MTDTPDSELRAGVAVADITPPAGAELSGGAFGPAKGVLQPLAAKALLLEQGSSRLLLISCDLLGFDWDYACAIRREISHKHGLAFEAIMLAATHTHCGPATVTLRNWGRCDQAYRGKLHGLLVNLAGRALAAAQPARFGAGVIDCPGVAVNRCLGERGPTNDRLGLMRVDAQDGRPIAILLNYACHPVNLHSSGMISPDFPYYVESNIRRALGGEVPVLYLSGACGDLNPANFKLHPSEQNASETAGRISEKALQLLPAVGTAPAGPLTCATLEVPIPLQPLPAPEELRRIIRDRRAKMEQEPDKSPTSWSYCGHKTNVEWAQEALEVIASGRQETVRTIALQGFRIGRTAIVGVPGEPFAELGLDVAEACASGRPAPGAGPPGADPTAAGPPAAGGQGGGPAGAFDHAFVVSLANGCFGYFASRAAYEKNSYEATGCPKFIDLYLFQPGALELLRQACLDLLGRLAG